MVLLKEDYFGLPTQSKTLTPRSPNVGNCPRMRWKFKLLFVLLLYSAFAFFLVSFVAMLTADFFARCSYFALFL